MRLEPALVDSFAPLRPATDRSASAATAPDRSRCAKRIFCIPRFLLVLSFLPVHAVLNLAATDAAEPPAEVALREPADTAWLAGAAKRVITPEQPMWMAGYAHRDHPAEGKLTELWAKALWLEPSSGDAAVIVTLDLIGIDRMLSQSVCERIEQTYGIDRSHIALCTSHTHTGPVVARNLDSMHYALLAPDQQRLVDQYARRLEDAIVQVVGQAKETRRPAKLAWASGRAAFAVNRRNNPEPQVPTLRAARTLQGPSDHDVPVMAVLGDDGSLHAVLFGYACHSTVLSSYEWSGDYGGFAQEMLEREFPGCVAMFWAGCGGDQNPLPRREVALAQQYGHELAGAVKTVLSGPLQPLAGDLQAKYREVDLPLDTLPTADELRSDLSSKNPYVAARAKLLLEKIDAGQPLEPTYPYPIQTWTLGKSSVQTPSVQIVVLGGEVVVDYAIQIKAQQRQTATWVIAYANDVMAYIPSRRVLQEGGYEGGGAMVYYGLPTHWAPDVERVIMDQVERQLE